MAKPQQDQTWPYRPPVNFYPQQMYPVTYQHTGICRDACCQQPRVPKPYRSLPYPHLNYSHQGNSFTRPPTSQYVPVNPYMTPRCAPHHQRNPVIHRPIPQNRYDYNDYYQFNQRLMINRNVNNDYVHENTHAQYPSNQYPPSSLYPTPQSETALPNIDVRQFLATWQDKDEDVVDPTEHARASTYPVNYNADPYQPLDCTKRNESVEQGCSDFDQARSSAFYTDTGNVSIENDESSLTNLKFTQSFSTANNTTAVADISTIPEQLTIDSCAVQPVEQSRVEKDLSYVPYERSIEKICNPRVFKSPTALNSAHKSLTENQCAMTSDGIFRNNLKDFKHNSERNQYYLNASLESDDLFDDINRKKDEKQKNVVHPLRHDEVNSMNKKEPLPQVPIKPNLSNNNQPPIDMPIVACHTPNKYSAQPAFIDVKTYESQLIPKPTKKKHKANDNRDKYALEFRPLIPSNNGSTAFDETYNIVSNGYSINTECITPEKTNPESDNQHTFTDGNILEENLKNDSDLGTVNVTDCHPPKSPTLLDGIILPGLEKKPIDAGVQELEISSDDIELSIDSSEELNVEDVGPQSNYDQGEKLPVEYTNKEQVDDISTNEPISEIEAFASKENASDAKDDDDLNGVIPSQTVSQLSHESEKSVDKMDSVVTEEANLQKTECVSFHKKNDCAELTDIPCELNNNEVQVKNCSTMCINSAPCSPKIEDTCDDSSCSSCSTSNADTSDSFLKTNALQNIAYSYQDLNLSEDSSETVASGNTNNQNIGINEISKIMKNDRGIHLKNTKGYSKLNLRSRYLSRFRSCSIHRNAVVNWKLKNRLLFVELTQNNSRLISRGFHREKTARAQSLVNDENEYPKTRALDILTECTNTNCEVNCVIYQSDIESYSRCEMNSILAEEVHICGKSHTVVEDDCQKNIDCCEEIVSVTSPLDEHIFLNSPSGENEAFPCINPWPNSNYKIYQRTMSSYTIATDSNNKKLGELITNFFSPGLVYESKVASSLIKPEIVNGIIIKDAEEVGVNNWGHSNVKTVAQPESIKCSLAWEKIFSSLIETNTIKNDSLELGPAKIHLTLSPKNDDPQKSKCGELKVFKAIINAKKLILKRNGLLEERIPKMVIKKSEGQGYRSFIKDVRITSKSMNAAETYGQSMDSNSADEEKPDEASSTDSEATSDRTLMPSLKQAHHCLLCHQSFYSLHEFNIHESSLSHRHLDLVQRNALHKVHNSLYGCDHPNSQPISDIEKEFLNWKPLYPGFTHNYHNALP